MTGTTTADAPAVTYYATCNGVRCTQAFATKREATMYVNRNNAAAARRRGERPYAVEAAK